MKYIDSEKLIAEIERRIGICKRVVGDERNEEDMRRYYQGKVVALEEIQHFADSLQQEQPEQVTINGKVDWFDSYFLDYDAEQWIDVCHTLHLKYGDKINITISKAE